MNKKKELYENILKFSKEITLLIQLENLEEIEKVLSKRQELIEKTSKKDFEIDEIKKILEQIKAIDNANFEKINDFKQEISEKMAKLSKNKSLIGFYKQTEINRPRLVDETSN